MELSALSDLTTRSLYASMRGLSVRRQAIQDNIANVETPGFLANTVSFESSLDRAMRAGMPEEMATSAGRSTAPTNQNGNNVQIDQEFVNLTENSLRSQLVTEALNAKYRLLRTSISGQ